MSGRTCPNDTAIQRLADGDATPEVEQHVRECPACRERLEAARQDASFLEHVSGLAEATLAPVGAPRVPGYRIIEVINSGSQGVVYKGMQESTSRPVAIKTLRAGEVGSARQRARAEREAEIVARLHHPGIVTVFESRTLADGRIAVVMEFIDGVPIDRWKPPGDTPAERQGAMLRAFVAACQAVHHAHLNGVIHRDLKPDNLLVTKEGRPVVVDFGIAKAGGGLNTTMTGEFAGTPAYASPEQAQGRPDTVDALTDVYSLGVILYKLLCGSLPYKLEGSIFEIARTIGEAAPLPMRTLDATISDDLDAIVSRALRKEKERRYQSAAALASDVERFLAGDPVDARSGSGWYLLRKAVSMNRRRLGLAGIGAVVVLGAAGVVAWSLAEAAASDRRAADQAERSNALRVRARAVTEVLREAMPNADPLHPELSNVIGDGLDRLYLRLETGVYATEPDVDQAVRRIWGQVYTGLGTGKASSRAQYAEVSLRNGLVRLRREHGPEHPEIAESMHELAALMLVRKRPEEALDLATRSLEMRRKLLGGDAVALADSHALLARIYNALREPGASLDHARTALASYRRLPERQADAPMGSMLALEARAFLDVRRAAAAEAPLRESLLRRLRALPPEDPDLLASLGDAALFAQLLPGSPLSVDIAACWGPAASAQRLRDDIPVLASPDRAGSEAPVRRSQALTRLSRFQELLLGPDDPAIVRTLMALSRAAHVEGDLRAKADASLHAADILTRRYGPDDSSVLVCLEEAAVVLAFDGDAARAADLGERALRIRQRTPPEARDPILEGGALRYQAWFLTLAGRYREGADYWERAGATLRSVVGPEHHAVALTRAGLAMCLAEEGRLEEADRVSAEALESGLKNPATTVGDQTANLRLARGLVLARLGRAEEAREQLLAAWDAFLGVHAPPRYPWRTLCARSLAECARRLNLPDEAARWDLALGQPPPAPESP